LPPFNQWCVVCHSPTGSKRPRTDPVPIPGIKKSRNTACSGHSDLVGRVGFEPTTRGLRVIPVNPVFYYQIQPVTIIFITEKMNIITQINANIFNYLYIRYTEFWRWRIIKDGGCCEQMD